MNKGADEFMRNMTHPVKSRLFLLWKLPSAFFSGVRLREINSEKAVATVPFKWFSQNPFRSTYFACLSMAAEMTTGVLGLANIYKRNPPVSMLVVKIDSVYHKKAVGLTRFTCSDGQLFRTAVEEAVTTGEPRVIEARSVGVNNNGELIAEFKITWSFRAKTII